jgi:hypothetical protein
VKAISERYKRASKADKGKILDEFTRTTGLHRKAVIRSLNRTGEFQGKKRGGRPKKYSSDIVAILKTVWEASDRLCSKRLKPFMPEMLRVLRHHGELHIDAFKETQLCGMSPATIDRLLKPCRRLGGRKSLSITRPGNLLRSAIPIKTFAEWEETKPGFLEVDLVGHCGESAEGFFLHTLCTVDVASGWLECMPVWGKGQQRVKTAVHHVRRLLPFDLLGVDSDNGSEFINYSFHAYCKEEGITFTRSRAYKKNDNCHVEQKNGNVVRRIIGYDRYASKAAYACLERIYSLVRLYMNFFQPTMKLFHKTRQGAKVYKVYEQAKTPYQRLLDWDVLTAAKRAELASTYTGLNPVQLLKCLNENLDKLWRLADRISVTGVMRQ